MKMLNYRKMEIPILSDIANNLISVVNHASDFVKEPANLRDLVIGTATFTAAVTTAAYCRKRSDQAQREYIEDLDKHGLLYLHPKLGQLENEIDDARFYTLKEFFRTGDEALLGDMKHKWKKNFRKIYRRTRFGKYSKKEAFNLHSVLLYLTDNAEVYL